MTMNSIYIVTLVCHGDSVSGKGTALRAFKTEEEAINFVNEDMDAIAKSSEDAGIDPDEIDISIPGLCLWIGENGYEYSIDKLALPNA